MKASDVEADFSVQR